MHDTLESTHVTGYIRVSLAGRGHVRMLLGTVLIGEPVAYTYTCGYVVFFKLRCPCRCSPTGFEEPNSIQINMGASRTAVVVGSSRNRHFYDHFLIDL